MSSVIVAGNVSGSVTLDAPAVAGSTVITLPTASGTMATLTTPSFATTIGVGNATPSASGAGITFPATQSASTDANTLDDYEEGTWTATSTWATQGTGYGSVTGQYTKVGNVINLRAYPQPVKGTASGNFSITGIPFVASENTAVSFRIDAIGATGKVVQGVLVAASSIIQFTLMNQSTTYGTIVTAADMNANVYMNIQCTYQI